MIWLNYISRRNNCIGKVEGGVKWILEGDANTGFFHSVANGRRRKCIIEFLDTESGRITEQGDLVAHIEAFFYKKTVWKRG
jgi:hypothetical protein